MHYSNVLVKDYTFTDAGYMAGVCTHMQLEAASFKPPYLVLTYTYIFLYLLAPHTNFGTNNHSLKCSYYAYV